MLWLEGCKSKEEMSLFVHCVTFLKLRVEVCCMQAMYGYDCELEFNLGFDDVCVCQAECGHQEVAKSLQP